MQRELIFMRECNNPKKVYDLQRKIVTSFEGRAAAVRRVTTSGGAKTPGVDGEVLDTPKKKLEAIVKLGEITQNPQSYRASPLRRE
jgi:RNA-directed DNA polymerase